MDRVQLPEISTDDIKITVRHRALRPWKVKHITDKMKAAGYNTSYPITIEEGGILVDGGHRVAAAKEAGIVSIPYVFMPDGVSGIRHALRCNEDGADTERYDVFDLAELCWGLAQDGWTGQQIADELGWGSAAKVSYYSGIRSNLHPRAWGLARGLTINDNLLRVTGETVVNPELTNVNWQESHFRALLKFLSWQEGDRAIMRAQLKAIRAIITRAGQEDKRFGQTQKMVTAKWIGTLAQRHAWHVQLAKHMRDNCVEKVSIRDRIDLLKNVYEGVFGNKLTDKNLEKFDIAVKRLNEKALRVTLYHDDAFQRLPLLKDASVALVITDPPYNVTDEDWDKIGTDEEYLEFMGNWLDTVHPKLAEDYHLFLFCDAQYQARIESLLLARDWPLKSRIIWSNRSLPAGRQVTEQFVQTWQMIFHCGTHSLNWPSEWADNRFDVQVFAAPNKNTEDGGYHPTPKPVGLIKWLIQIGSKPTDIILDPFAGGGTLGAASIQVRQRQCILIEKEDRFCMAIENRLNIRREGMEDEGHSQD